MLDPHLMVEKVLCIKPTVGCFDSTGKVLGFRESLARFTTKKEPVAGETLGMHILEDLC